MGKTKRNISVVLPGFWTVLILLLVASGYIFHLNGKLKAAEALRIRHGLVLDSLQVESDTLRNISRLLRRELDESARDKNFYETRSYQLEFEKDSLDNLLRRETQAKVDLTARVEKLQDTLVAYTRRDGIDRTAHFEEYIPPYTVDIRVALPPPPMIGLAEVSVELDPITAGVRIQCSEDIRRTGVRSASVFWEGPSWLVIDSLGVVQDPEVCNAVKTAEIGWMDKAKIGTLGAAFGLLLSLVLK